MGSYYSNGFISKLPISEGDECFGIIGIYNPQRLGNRTSGVGEVITPICLPIFGSYDGYGSLTNITRDKNVEVLEKYSKLSINTILENISSNSAKSTTLLAEFPPPEIYDGEVNGEGELILSIDHIHVYQELSKVDIGIDWERSYELSTEAQKISMQYYKGPFYYQNRDLTVKYMGDIPFVYFNSLWSNLLSSREPTTNLEKRKAIVNITPYYMRAQLHYDISVDNLLLYQLMENNDILMLEMKDQYIEYLKFYYTCRKLSINYLPNTITGVSCYEIMEKLLPLYEKSVDFMKKKLT